MYKSKSDNKKPVKNKKRALKKEEVELFKTHSKHHSKEHIEEMKKFIKEGRGCYSDSHKHASKKYPK